MAAAPARLHVGQSGVKRLRQCLGAGQQQQGGRFGDSQQFLGIDRDRIGLLQASNPMAVGRHQAEHSPDSAIHMQPQAAPLANPSYRTEGVDCPPNSGASGGNYRDHWQPSPLELIKLHLQSSWI